ncbi:MAG: nucleotide sugar aminotransferase [Rhodocyclales bacterium]|nr:nucleotide sugar aminotransferase [Rhodocyclales bacterium]
MTLKRRIDGVTEIPPTAGLPILLGDLLTPWRANFAESAAEHIGVSHAGLECSGTACLVVILSAMRQGSARRSVVVPAYTCPLVVFAVLHCGLRVRVCDLSVDSFELDPAALRAVCDDDTLAIIPVHLAGRVANLDEVIAIARQCNAYVIEDAAQSFGAQRGGTSIGLQGDAGFFSFAAGKGLSLYEGGLWIARDATMQNALALASKQAIPRKPSIEALRCLQLAGYAALYRPLPLRFVYGWPLRRALRRGDAVEAVGDNFSADIPLHRVSAWRRSVGCNALQRLTNFHAALAAQAARRLPDLAKLSGVKVFGDRPGRQGVWPSFLLLMPSKATRDAVMLRLWGARLGVTRMFVNALPDYAYLHDFIASADVPNARDFAARSLTISNSLWLDDERFQQIVKTLEDVLFRDETPLPT